MEVPDNHCNTVALEAKNDVCTDIIQDFQYIGWRQEWKYQITCNTVALEAKNDVCTDKILEAAKKWLVLNG
jgi:hypothetical protein